jgi:Protein of unknown function (DUF4242)
MEYFMDTHDRAKGSFPIEDVTTEEFLGIFADFQKAYEAEGATDQGGYVNLAVGKVFCFTKGPDPEAIRRAHERMKFPFDSITEVRRVTGVDLR